MHSLETKCSKLRLIEIEGVPIFFLQGTFHLPRPKDYGPCFAHPMLSTNPNGIFFPRNSYLSRA